MHAACAPNLSYKKSIESNCFFKETQRLKGCLNVRKAERRKLSNSNEILLSLSRDVMTMDNFYS